MRNHTFRLALLAGALTSLAAGDTLTLRNGQSVEGTFLGGTARQVRIEVRGEVQTFDVGQVQSVFFADPAPAQAQRDPPPVAQTQAPRIPSPPARDERMDGRVDGRVDDQRPMADHVTIPADTAITVRMVDSVNSETSRTGQTFMASLDEPVVVDGNPVIPRGADVMTKLVYDQNAGKLTGRTVLTLVLVSVKANGQWVDMTSYDVRTESSSQGAKSAKVVGGGAVLGALIGGIVGGGKGAAIGAGSGAAVGTGAAVATSGEKVTIPSETRLTFRLQNPAQL
jgi:hypothetical protein